MKPDESFFSLSVQYLQDEVDISHTMYQLRALNLPTLN